MKNNHEKYLSRACELAEENVLNGGGPFGAVIVRDGEILAEGVNRVTPSCDPTAHAEVNAIRNACKKIGDFQLKGCTVYSSCEPCPMCLSALYWAGVEHIYYGNTQQDAEDIDFSDKFIYEELALEQKDRHLPCEHLNVPRRLKAFKMWAEKDDKVKY